jgi:nitroreductase
MELINALRTTGSIRTFTEKPVTDEVIWSLLDDARFAPSGGNRQAWRVIVVRSPAQRLAVRDIYLEAWHDYVGHVLAGLIPFSPLASGDDRSAALAQRENAEALSKPDGFPETLHEVPAMLVVCADLAMLAAVDRDLERYQMVGGASIYPFVWSILLAARAHGLAGVMTTVATRNEGDLLEALSIPSSFAVASVVALGYPAKLHTKLNRNPVEEFTTIDAFNGAPFTSDQAR